jgi:adenylate cyclase
MLSSREFIIPALLTSIVGGVLLLTNYGQHLETEVGLSWLFNTRGSVTPPDTVLVVSIDEVSAHMLNQPSRLRDWDRALHGELVKILTDRGAEAIIFDVFFYEARPVLGDGNFAQDMRESGRVVLAQQIEQVRNEQAELVMTGDLLRSPTQELRDAAFGLAPFPLPRVRNRFDQYWAFYDSVTYPATLPVVALQVQLLSQLDYGQYLQLLRDLQLNVADELPEQLGDPAELRDMMTALRAELRSDPAAVNEIKDRFASYNGQIALPDSVKKLFPALLDAYAGADRYFLNFYGPAGSIPTVSYSSFWDNGDRAPNAMLQDLHGKVIIIGGTAQTSISQADGFYTVYSAGGDDVAGVEIAATAYANLLNGRWIVPASMLANLLVVLLFGVVIAYQADRLSGVWVIPATVATGAAYFGIATLLFASAAIWVAVVIPVAIQVPLVLIAGYLLRFLRARTDRDRFSKTLRLYVPERVAREYDLGHEPQDAPEVVYGICMSTDVQGYTTLAEKIPEAEVADLTRQYFTSLGDCVARNHGEMLEVRGDGMNAVWAAVQPEPILNMRACTAACEIQRAVSQFNEAHPKGQMPTRIGLHAGRVALGNVGGGGRLSYSIFGDSINTAARIQELNKVTRTYVLASEPVVRDLDDWLMRRVCDFQPKGKHEIIPIYEILGPLTDADDERYLLCQQFAEALKHLEQNDWPRAAELLAATLAIDANDGPALFHLSRCQRFQQSPPPAGEAVLIRSET